ncbi:hypothetical protein CMV_028891 [Castanea mollissima]|uniref:TIR domain-containing protein n=2 Tax=Castanea mollissima TaxID=60419 RepID=A0A8J4V4M7_9ROSI|nr:hypothetical protein CMV_028891 [Castanea mollissima]
MECRRRLKRIVIPIFYHVEPSDVRNQRGSYEEAFVEHEKRYLLDKDKVFRWRGALTEATNLAGFRLPNPRGEAMTIREIIQEISLIMDNKYLFVALYPVGVEARMKDMTSLLCVGANDVRMVGILGMGGTGKTTIAKASYNKFYHHFEGKCFLHNVRETSKKHGLVHLQKQLLSKTLRTRKIEVSSVDSGIVMIQERFRHKRVLVIVDDVDQLEQLNAIAGSRDWFGLGSRIIITTRDEQLLKNLQVYGVYRAKQMGTSESLELFSWHAFRNKYPAEGYMGISGSVVAYSGGLPLALEVLGSFLFGRSMQEWNCALEKLKRIPNDQVQQKLRISFDALSDDTEKDTFLDISCFFIGMDKNYVVQILDGCGFFADIGINVLIQRCLLTVDESNKLMMHDLLRDMGREIVRENYPKEPGKRSRLWLQEEVIDILTLHKGMKRVEGLALKLPRSEVNFNTKRSEVNFNTVTFLEMQRLRLLQLDYAQLNGDYVYLSQELRWLRWHGFPLKFIPNNFYPRKIVAIDLRYSNLREVWKDPKLHKELVVLNLSLDKLLKYFGILHMEGCNNMISSFKQSILQECIVSGVGNMFSIFLPGDDIPDCFMYKDEGPSVCFEVPIGRNVAGFVVCIVYSPCASNDNIVSQNLLSISVVNHTKNISQTSRQITADVVISSEDHLWLGNVSKDEFNLEGGDIVDVIIDFGAGFIVKKIGVSLLYDGVRDGKMIPYASTSSEDVRAQAWPIKFKRGLHDEEAGPSHGWVEDEPQPKRLKK